MGALTIYLLDTQASLELPIALATPTERVCCQASPRSVRSHADSAEPVRGLRRDRLRSGAERPGCAPSLVNERGADLLARPSSQLIKPLLVHTNGTSTSTGAV